MIMSTETGSGKTTLVASITHGMNLRTPRRPMVVLLLSPFRSLLDDKQRRWGDHSIFNSTTPNICPFRLVIWSGSEREGLPANLPARMNNVH